MATSEVGVAEAVEECLNLISAERDHSMVVTCNGIRSNLANTLPLSPCLTRDIAKSRKHFKMTQKYKEETNMLTLRQLNASSLILVSIC